MANNPTVVVAHLDDAELKKSVDNLVSYFNQKLGSMVSTADDVVTKLQSKLNTIGDINKSGVSNKSGKNSTSKLVDEQKNLKKAFDESSASYNKLLGALQMAQRQERVFASKNPYTMSREELDKYAETLVLVGQLQERLNKKRAEMNLAKVELSQSSFDAKAYTKDLLSVDDRLKQLNKYYAEQEKLSKKAEADQERLAKKAEARQKMIDSAKKAEEKYQNDVLKGAFKGALTMPSGSVDEITKKIERITLLAQTLRKEGLIDEAQVNRANAAVAKLNEQLQKQATIEKDIKSTQVQQALGVKERRYQDDILRTVFNQTLKMPEENFGQIQRKIEAITSKLAILRDLDVITPNKIQMADAMVARLKQESNAISEQLTIQQQRVTIEQKLSSVSSQRSSLEAQESQSKERIKNIDSQLQSQQQLRMQVSQRIVELENQNAELEQKKNNAQSLWIQSGNKVVEQKQRLRELNSEIESQEKKISQFRQQYPLIANIQSAMGGFAKGMQKAFGGELDGIVAAEEKLNNLKKERATIEARLALMEERTSDATKQTHAAAESAYKTRQKNEKEIVSLNKQIEAIDKEIASTQQKKTSEEGKLVSITQNLAQATEQQKQVQQELAAFNTQNVENKKQELATQKEITKEAEKQQELASKKRQYIKPEASEIEITRAMIANMISSKTGWTALNWDEQTSSIKRLQDALNQYKVAYSKMTAVERNSPYGKQFISDIQVIEKALKRLKQEMSKPLNLQSIINMPEKTLDQLSEKMRQLSQYRGGLDINKQAGEMAQVSSEYDRIKKKMDELMGKNAQMEKSNNALTRSWNYMKNRLAFYFTVGASTAFIKNLIEVRSQYEMNERALGILVNSAERGTQIFNELSQMALVSPYTLIELSNAARQLTAYDVAAKDVVDTTRRLADITAAVGIPVERLTYALGQIKAYGYLNSRDARMFLNAGIPLTKALADHFSELEGRMVSVGDVYDRIKNKAIGFNDVMQVINEMTDKGGKFFDFQAKMADTLKVQLANLTLAWNNMLNDMGASQQGVLVGGIRLIKQALLHWRDLNNAIVELAITFGTLKLVQTAYYLIVRKTNNAIALQYVLGGKLAKNIRGLRDGFTELTGRIRGASAATKRFISFSLGTAAAIAIVTAIADAYYENKKAVEDFNKAIRDGAADNSKNISEFLEQYKEVRDSLQKKVEIDNPDGTQRTVYVNTNIDKSEGNKAWAAMREQIELTTTSSNNYIAQLLQIEDVSERLRQGFALLDDLQEVNNALAEMDDNVIHIQQDWSQWWNLWLANDSLKENIQDLIDSNNKLIESYGSVAEARKKAMTIEGGRDANLASGLSAYDRDVERLKKNLDDTNKSILAIINNKGWGNDAIKIGEVYDEVTSKLIEKAKLTSEQSFIIQMEMEERKAAMMKSTLEHRIADEKTALEMATDENTRYAITERIKELEQEYKAFSANNGKNKKMADLYFDFIAKRYKSTATTLFRDLNAKEIANLDFSKGNYAKFIEETTKQFAKENNLSHDEVFTHLKRWVSDANTWSVNIPLIISSEDEKGEYETLTELDKKADEAYSKIERLKTRRDELIKEGASSVGTEEKDKEYIKTLDELTQAEKDYNDAVAAGGHSKKEDRADKKGASETELQKALKEELSLIDKVRSAYNSLIKDGVNSQKAISESTFGLDETVNSINKTLEKFGLEKLDLTKFAGTQNPRDIMDMLQAQLDKLLSSGNVKTAEIKDLQVKIRDFRLDATSFDQKKITDSLNSELSRIKDEYELFVELDATPELTDSFTSIFDVDMDRLPKTAEEYAGRLMEAFNKAFEKEGKDFSLSDLMLSDKQLEELKEESLRTDGRISEEDYKAIEKAVNDIRALRKKEAEERIKQTLDLQYKLADVNGKIAVEQEKLARLETKYAKETNEEKKHLLNLQIQDQKDAIAKLGEEVLQLLPTYKKLFGSVAEHSARVTRKIAKEWKDALENAVQNKDGSFTVTDPTSGEKATVSRKEYGNQIDKVNGKLRETQSVFDKIHKAFTKGEEGEIDFAKGLELVAIEAQKAAAGIHTIADIIGYLGGEEAEGAVEVLNDVATSMEGLSTAGQGYAQIMNGDYIGGSVNVLKGTWQAVSTWFDNNNKKIDRAIKQSERAIKKLENAYSNLEHAESQAYGAATIEAKEALVANKKLQLVELERQLELEKSRKKKNQDKDRIMELEGEIDTLKNEIHDASQDIINDMLGISSAGDAITTLVSTMIDAFRNGEDAMKAFGDKWDEMIDNMILKLLVTTYMQKAWDKVMAQLDAEEEKFVQRAEENRTDAQTAVTQAQSMTDDQIAKMIARELGYDDKYGTTKELKELIQRGRIQGSGMGGSNGGFIEAWQQVTDEQIAEYRRMLEGNLQRATESVETASTDFLEYSIDYMSHEGYDFIRESATRLVEALGDRYQFGELSNLSDLQQGISGISEDTAGALEAYMNGVSQQVYLQSDLLQQINTTLQSIDFDAQLGTMGEMLLQLQQSYAVQQAIQGILEGWSTPSGLAVRVSMVE